MKQHQHQQQQQPLVQKEKENSHNINASANANASRQSFSSSSAAGGGGGDHYYHGQQQQQQNLTSSQLRYRSRSTDGCCDTRNTIDNEGLSRAASRRKSHDHDHHQQHHHPTSSSLSLSPSPSPSYSSVRMNHYSHGGDDTNNNIGGHGGGSSSSASSHMSNHHHHHHRRSYTVDSLPPPYIPTSTFHYYSSDAAAAAGGGGGGGGGSVAATSPGKIMSKDNAITTRPTTTTTTTTNMMMYNTPTNSFDTAPTTPPSSPPHHYQGNNRTLRLQHPQQPQQEQEDQQQQQTHESSSLKASPHPIPLSPTRSPPRSSAATSPVAASGNRPAIGSPPRTPPSSSSPQHRRARSGIVGGRSPFSFSRSPSRSRTSGSTATEDNIMPPMPSISIGGDSNIGEDDYDSNLDLDDDIEGEEDYDEDDGSSTIDDGDESCTDTKNRKKHKKKKKKKKKEDKKLNIVRSMEGLLWNANYVLGHALRPGIQGIQTDLFRTCSGICILSSATVGLLISGSVGTGVFMRHIKQHDTWSSPVACGIASLSVGALVGGALKDLFIFFMDDDSVEAFYKKGVRVGMKLNITLGIGRVGESHFGSSKDGKKAETLTFGFTQGIFVGASIDGGVVGPRRRINEKFYGKGKKSPAHIVGGKIPFPFHNQLAVKIMKELTDKLNEAGKRSLKSGRRKTAETTVLSALTSSLSPFKTSNHKKSSELDQDDIFYIENETGVSNEQCLSSTVPMNRVKSDPSNSSNNDFKIMGSGSMTFMSHPAPSLPSLPPRDHPFFQQEASHQQQTIRSQPPHTRTGSCDAFGSVYGEMHRHRHSHSYSASEHRSQPAPTPEPAFYPGINDLDQFCSQVARSGHIRRQSLT